MSSLGSFYTTLDAKMFEDAATLLPGYIVQNRAVFMNYDYWGQVSIRDLVHV